MKNNNSFSIFLYSNSNVFDITNFVIDDLILKSYQDIIPSKLSFDLLNHKEILTVNILNGCAIKFIVDEKVIFFGYIFRISKDSKKIKVICYDQIRYLKNKDTYIYFNKSSSDLIKSIISEFNLKTGFIQDTGFKINYRTEENRSLAQIIENSLQITFENTGKKFIFFDDGGKLSLKSSENMKSDFICSSDYSFIRDYNLDFSMENLYNKIKILVQDKRRKVSFTIEESDKNSQKNYGVLQFFQRISYENNISSAKNIAKNILSEKNKISQDLEVFTKGDISIIGGSIIYVLLTQFDEKIINKSMQVLDVTHYFNSNYHFMKLSLIST